MSKDKIVNFFRVFTLRQWGIASTSIVAVCSIAGLLLAYFAYQFGATCFTDDKYQLLLSEIWVVVVLSRGLIVLSPILCIILVFFKTRVAAIRFMFLLPAFFVGFLALNCIAEPLQFHCLRGFVKQVPQRVDVESIQSWLDNTELEQTDRYFSHYSRNELPEEFMPLNPQFVSVYSDGTKRAVRFFYGNRATVTSFGVIITGKDTYVSDVADDEDFRWNVKDISQHCYIWSGKELSPASIEELSGL
ncbi:MAG: hypothetical protein ACIAQZ_05955 [Sedimentisphaeraceae bacterium JB056]